MSPDEGDLWATATAPTMSEVIVRQGRLDAGKLPIPDLMLHGWIGLFGSSLAAMRAMSALFGVLSILLVYFVSRELFVSEPDGTMSKDDIRKDDVRMTAALAALVFAVNLVSIKYSREARMYPVMLAAILAQVGMFLRALARGGVANYVAVAVLTVFAVGTHFAAALVPASEVLWLGYIVARARFRRANPVVRRGLAVAIALAASGCVFAPNLFSAFRSITGATPTGAGHAHCGFCGCCGTALPALYAPLTLFNKATGSFGFPILAALAIWGIVRGWRRHGSRDAIGFALIWMWGAPLMMLLVSYALRPILVERYALASFVAFFILVALGIFEMPSGLVRIGALVLAIAFSAGHIVSYDRKPHDAQYREAIPIAKAALKPGETMTAIPPYAINVIRYYLPADQLDRAVRYDAATANTAVLIMDDEDADKAESYRNEYPQVVARLRGVTVLRK